MSVALYHGDCLDVLPQLDADSVDTCITDPPYGLEFMGKDWDHGVPGVAFWQKVYRVLKPGAMLLAFGGTRTHHRLMVAIEDAGFEIRDCMMWLYGSGFPKSHDISKAIDKAAGKEREDAIKGGHMGISTHGGDGRNGKADAWHGQPMHGQINKGRMTRGTPVTNAAQQWDGWGTALKPAAEIITLAMKPRDGTFAENAQKHGVAGMWIDGARIGTDERLERRQGANKNTAASLAPNNGYVSGPQNNGRWPANVILDEEAAAMLDEQSGELTSGALLPTHTRTTSKTKNAYGEREAPPEYFPADAGGASRFFYCAKSSRRERNEGLEGLPERERTVGVPQSEGRKNHKNKSDGQHVAMPAQNHHPTVKPLDLLRYLCKLTKTPTGGVVLDPFMGSGSTGCAAVLEGRDFIGIELEAEYMEIAERRIEHHASKPRQLELI